LYENRISGFCHVAKLLPNRITASDGRKITADKDQRNLDFIAKKSGEPGWDRTIDLLIKSQPLYH
jgi:hypothetical protein